jgi:hypothetical protein
VVRYRHTWHSAVEFKRYLHRFMLEFSRIETLAGVKRTDYNQYDSLVVPLQRWLESQGVRMITDCQVTDLDHRSEDGKFIVTGIQCLRQDKPEAIAVNDGDLVFLQNASMTDASSLGSMTKAPAQLTKADSVGWTLWEKLAHGRLQFGNPAAFNSCIAQSYWASFTVTLNNPAFFDKMNQFSGNEAGTGGLVTFKDSSWLMSIRMDSLATRAKKRDSGWKNSPRPIICSRTRARKSRSLRPSAACRRSTPRATTRPLRLTPLDASRPILPRTAHSHPHTGCAKCPAATSTRCSTPVAMDHSAAAAEALLALLATKNSFQKNLDKGATLSPKIRPPESGLSL